MSSRFFRRLGKLYKLLLMDERMTAMESRAVRDARLRDAIDRLRSRVDRLSARVDNHAVLIDALKSNLEVPQELIDEFVEWKVLNPIPKRPLVSVIVPTYNRARLLTERCLPSILEQTYENVELIVVGDGCTDETEELMSHIDDKRLTFFNLPEKTSTPGDPALNRLVTGTIPRNHGLVRAKGDFITYLDDDDEYTLDRLEKLVKFASDEDCDLVWHPFWIETDTGEWELIEAQKFALGHVSSSSVLYRSWFKKIPWDPNAYLLMEPDDWNLFRRIKYINPICRRYVEPLYNHYQ